MFFPGSSEYNYKPSLGSSINWNHPLSEGLIACYLFNEVSGLKSYDISRYNVAGTLTNGALFSNIDGGIVTLDGVNDYISLTETPIVNTSGVTIEIWFRTTQTSQALILQTPNYGGGLYLNRFTNTGKLFPFFDNSSGNNSSSDESTISVNDNLWHCAVATYANNITSLYIDGKLNKQYADTYSPSLATNAYNIGWNVGTSTYFAGSVLKYSAYNRALSEEEIKSLYENPYQFIISPSHLRNYSYRQQGVLFAPSITSAESMGSAIMPGPVTLGVSSIASQEKFGNETLDNDSVAKNRILTELRFDSALNKCDYISISTPSISSVTQFGSTGSTTYSYRVSALSSTGETLASIPFNITNGNSSLSSVNYIRIIWNKVPYAVSYNVYGRTLLEEKLIVNIVGIHYDDIGISGQNIHSPSINTTGYNHNKLNLGPDMRLYTGPKYIDNYISTVPTRIYRRLNHRFMSLLSIFDYTEHLTWIFTVENNNWTGQAIQAFLFDKRTNEVYPKGWFQQNIPNNTNNQTKTDFTHIYDKYSNGTVACSGTAVTGTNTSWYTDKVCAGARIGFGSTEPEFITDWYEIASVNSDFSITLLSTGPTVTNSLYCLEELRFLLFQRHSTTNFGGLYYVKGCNFDDFKTFGIITVPTATTVDRIKACYFLSDAATGTLTHSQGIALSPKINSNTQYVYGLHGRNTDANDNQIFTWNVRADLTNITSGNTTSALVSKTQKFNWGYSGNAMQQQYNSVVFANTKHGPGKNKNSLYIQFYDRTHRIETDKIIRDNSNAAPFEYVMQPTKYGTAAGSIFKYKLNYMPEEDLFYGCDSSHNTHYGEYNLGYKAPINHFFSSYRFNNNSNNPARDIPDHLDNYSGSIGSKAINRYTYLTNNVNNTDNCLFYYCHGADFLFCKKYKNQIITPSIATFQSSKLIKVIVNDEMIRGRDTVGINTENYRIYARTTGIEDDSGYWNILDATGDISFLKPTDKIQYMFEFQTIGFLTTPREIFSVSTIFESNSEIIPEFEWSLSDSGSNVVGFIQNEKIRKDFILLESQPIIKISAFDYDTNTLLFSQNSNQSTYGVFQYHDGSSWVTGLGANTTNKRMRFVVTTTVHNNKKLYFKINKIDNRLFKFDGNNSSSIISSDIYDISEAYSKAVSSNVTINKGLDYSLLFSSNSALSFASDLYTQSLSNFTILVTFNISNNISTSASLITRNNGGGNNFFDLYFDYSTSTIRFWIGNSSVFVSDGKFQKGKNYNIILSYDGTNIKLFVNGKLNKTSSFTYNLSSNSYNVIELGKSLSGSIFYAEIYNRSMSANEVTRAYSVIKSKLNTKLNGYVRKPLPNSIAYSTGTITINNTPENTYINGLLWEFYDRYPYDKFDYLNFQYKLFTPRYIINSDVNPSILDNFHTHFYGKFKAPQTGTYTFTMFGDDTARLWVGVSAVSGYNTTNSVLSTNNGTYNIALNANDYLDFRAIHSEGGGFNQFYIRMSGPGITSTSNGLGFYYYPVTNVNRITGSSTTWLSSVTTDLNKMLIGSNDINEGGDIIDIHTPLDETNIVTKSALSKTYSGSLSYSILKGLSLYLDASELASYPGYGDTWYDLSGNKNDMVMFGNVEWNEMGYFTYFSRQDFFHCKYPDIARATLPNELDPCTIIVVTKTPPQYYNWPVGGTVIITLGNDYVSDRSFGIWIEQNTRRLNIPSKNVYDNNIYQIDENRNYVLGVTYNGIQGTENNKMWFHINGVKNSFTVNDTSQAYKRFESLRIGAFMNTPAHPYTYNDGKIYAVLIFNRALSNTEMLEISNYYSDKFNF